MQIGFAFLVPAYAGCPGKEDVAIVHYHTRLMAAVPGQPALTRKVKQQQQQRPFNGL